MILTERASIRRHALLGLLWWLSGCTASHFDCPHIAGVSCQSLEQINRQIDAGDLPLLALGHKECVLC